ncbi:MAG: hypothetical protein ACXVB0_24580 [Mucilaginibacter sp.]
MRTLFFIAAIICVIGCKKESKQDPDPIINLPYTRLTGHTWEGLSFTDSVTAVPYYQFLHVKSDTTVGVYTATYDGINIIEPEVVYPCKLVTHTNHLDSLEIFYFGVPNPSIFHTTKDTTIITDGYIDYKKFK